MRQEFLRPQQYNNYEVHSNGLQSKVVSRLGHVPLDKDRRPIRAHKGDRYGSGDLLNLLSVEYSDNSCELWIFKSTTFSVFTKATEDVLSRTDEIELSLNQSSP